MQRDGLGAHSDVTTFDAAGDMPRASKAKAPNAVMVNLEATVRRGMGVTARGPSDSEATLKRPKGYPAVATR